MERKQTSKTLPVLANQQVIQSYVLTTARYSFSIYEKRILTNLIRLLQPLLEGKHLIGKVEQDLWGDYHFELPLSLLVQDEDTNFERYKQAFLALNEKKFEYEDAEVWRVIRLIERPQYKKGKGEVRFDIASQLVNAFLDFNKGFSQYNLGVSLSLKSIYAVRMYELISNQKHPITYSIEKLKKIFNITDQKAYDKTFNFINRCITPAKLELDATANWSFNYEPLKRGNKITALKFTPIHYRDREPEELQRAEARRKTHLSGFVAEYAIRQMLRRFGFTIREIKNNATTVNTFCQLPNINHQERIAEIWQHAAFADNPKGYVIRALTNEIEKFKGSLG